MRSSRITDALQIITNETFSLVKCIQRYVYGPWSFWSWFDVNRSIFDEDMREKMIFTFSFPVTLTFDLFIAQICSPSYSCPALFHWIRSFCGFPISRKSKHGTDGQTDGVQRLMRPSREGRVKTKTMIKSSPGSNPGSKKLNCLQIFICVLVVRISI